MAVQVIKSMPNTKKFADAHNLLRKQIGAGAFFHLDATEKVLSYSTLSGSDAAATAAALAAANNLMAIYLLHIADTLAHKAAWATPVLVKATSLATAITLANAIKADHNNHIGDTSSHYNADATNTIAATDATTLASLQTMLNEFLNTTGLKQHMASAPASGYALRAVDM